MEQKKNNPFFIIPASFFTKQLANTTKEQQVKKNVVKKTTTSVNKPTTTQSVSKTDNKNYTSGLSLSSIRAKRNHIKKTVNEVDEANQPREKFLEPDFHKAWKEFIDIARSKKKKILVSILEMQKPKLNGTAILLQFPNETIKLDLEREQFDLLNFLRANLKNYDIHLKVTVNESESKKYVFTDAEKFEKLKEKNSSVELLKNIFGLDI